MLRSLALDELVLDDEASFRHVAIYDVLKQRLVRDGYRFRAPLCGQGLSWDRALFLNLTYWSAAEQGDVLTDDHVPADVIAHVAWHHAARCALGAAASTADGLLLGEAVASAFDLYLVGRLLGHADDSSFLATQVPAMAEVAEEGGLAPEAFEALLEEVAAEPERAFEDLRALLFDAATTLVGCGDAEAAAAALDKLAQRRFAPLLHHYELSNWVLYARAHGRADPGADPLASNAAVRAVDAAIRAAPDAVAWLEQAWLL